MRGIVIDGIVDTNRFIVGIVSSDSKKNNFVFIIHHGGIKPWRRMPPVDHLIAATNDAAELNGRQS